MGGLRGGEGGEGEWFLIKAEMQRRVEDMKEGEGRKKQQRRHLALPVGDLKETRHWVSMVRHQVSRKRLAAVSLVQKSGWTCQYLTQAPTVM